MAARKTGADSVSIRPVPLIISILVLVVVYLLDIQYFGEPPTTVVGIQLHNILLSIVFLLSVMVITHVVKVIWAKSWVLAGRPPETFSLIWPGIFLIISTVAVIGSLMLLSGTTEGLGVSVGLITAVITFALQRPILNIAGWLVILTKRPFNVGDVLKIDDKSGLVTEINPLFVELREVRTDHEGIIIPGKHLFIPNSVIFEKTIQNASHDQNLYVEDRLTVQVTYESNLYHAKQIMLRAARSVVGENMKAYHALVAASMESPHLASRVPKEPVVYVDPKDSGMDITVRYQCNILDKIVIASQIFEVAFETITRDRSVEIAYPHMQIVPHLIPERTEKEDGEAVADVDWDPSEPEGTVLVPVGNLKHGAPLVRLASLVGKGSGLGVNLFSVLQMDRVMKRGVLDYEMIKGQEKGLEKLTSEVSEDITVTSGVQVAQSVPDGILQKAYQSSAEIVLLGWGGPQSSSEVLDPIIQSLVSRVSRKVAVVKALDFKDAPKKIGVLIHDPSIARSAIELALCLTDCCGGKLELVRATSSKVDPEKVKLETLAAIYPDGVPEGFAPFLKVISSRNLATALLNEMSRFDLCISSTKPTRRAETIFLGSTPEKILQKADKPLVVLRV